MRTIGRVFLAVLLAAGSLLLTAASADRGGGRLDGFVIRYVPERAGGLVSDFSTEWEGVEFASRVWERHIPEDGYRVDLKVNILRGERLTDLAALRDFLAEYHERDPEEWDLVEFRHGSRHGYRAEGQIFWLVSPGVGVSLTLAPERFGDNELRDTAWGIQKTH